jgi:hypothetical protein
MVDLEEKGGKELIPPILARNLRIHVSKIQDLRPKMDDFFFFFAILGMGPSGVLFHFPKVK